MGPGARSEQVDKLVAWLSDIPDGTMLSWLEIEQQTGISMDPKGPGRSLVRDAMNRAKRPYHSVYGSGVRLADSMSAISVIRAGDGKVFRAVKRSHKRSVIVVSRFEDMPESDRHEAMQRDALRGAMLASSKALRALTPAPVPPVPPQLPSNLLPKQDA